MFGRSWEGENQTLPKSRRLSANTAGGGRLRGARQQPIPGRERVGSRARAVCAKTVVGPVRSQEAEAEAELWDVHKSNKTIKLDVGKGGGATQRVPKIVH